MHHKSVESQQAYTRPTSAQTQKALEAGLAALSSKHGVPDPSLLSRGHWPDKPPRLQLD
jgi:hypothetical protein